MSKRKILVATTNPGKIAELAALLENIQWLGLADLPPLPEVVEDGDSFAENARKKARQYAQASDLWTLSDDSGLVVDALNGAPGVHSARYAGVSNPDRRVVDQANIDKVLARVQGVPEEERSARFVCCLCLASPTDVLIETTGTVMGRLISSKRGHAGFGYDPIFFLPDLGKTMAQLSPEEKNALSHRGQALRALKPELEQRMNEHASST